MDVQTTVVQQEVARVKRVRELGVELQRIALDLSQAGEAEMSSRVLGVAFKASRAKGRAVEAVPAASPIEKKGGGKSMAP